MKKIRNNYFHIPEGCEIDINKSTLKKPVFIKNHNIMKISKLELMIVYLQLMIVYLQLIIIYLDSLKSKQ